MSFSSPKNPSVDQPEPAKSGFLPVLMRTLLLDHPLETPFFARSIELLTRISTHRSLPLIFLTISAVRALLLLWAYPPAHQSDSDLFFLYADRLSGYDWPLLDKVTYPAYPFLILVTEKWLGSAMWLIVLQFFMSITIVPLYYLMLKPYSSILALVVALVMLSDVQSAATFNFSGAEPLYIFLLTLTFFVLLRQTAPGASRRASAADSLTGILLVLLWLTRTIGRYLIVPYALVFWLYTRSLRRTLTLLAGFGATAVLYAALSTVVLGQVVGMNATDYAFERVMRHHPDWVSAENGPNSRIWIETVANCDPPEQFHLAYCIYQQTGVWEEAEAVIQGAAFETIRPHIVEYLVEVWNNTMYFLSSSAEVYNLSEELPSTVQCQNLEARMARIDADFVRTHVTRLTIPLLGIEPGPQFDVALSQYKGAVTNYTQAFCPPTVNSVPLRDLVDELMSRNRVFGRPNPYLWYGGVLLLSLMIPFARRFLPVVLVMGVTLAMLAISPAMLSVHVNPRYVIPVNSLRIVLLSILVFILIKLAVYLMDALVKRTQRR